METLGKRIRIRKDVIIMNNITSIWSLYEKGVQRHREMGLAADVEQAYRFFEGDQWWGLESEENLPVYNLIAPTVKYKVANVAMNQMQIYFSSLLGSERSARLTKCLNRMASMWWERLNMDTLCWRALRDSAVAGESYLYIYDDKGNCQLIDNTDVFLGDERESDIQRQPYILLYERRDVREVRRMAEAAGVQSEDIEKIVSDNAERSRITTQKHGEDDGKCGCLLYMTKEGQDIVFARCTKYVKLGAPQRIAGLGLYPVVSLVTAQKKGSARGRGEVRPLIPNQIEVNRNLVRRIINAKMTAFSRLVYATDKIDNPEALEQVGSAIAVSDSTIADIHGAVGYVTPSPMSADARLIGDELMQNTRELAGAGNALTGNIDPTMASGAAIIAVRDQAQIPLNENMALYRRFVEDIATVWYRLWSCYGLDIGVNEDNFTVLELKGLRPLIRVDATSHTPFSKYAREDTLSKLFEQGAITLEEYVDSLDDDSSIPKTRLMEIIKRRKEQTDGTFEAN